MKINKISFCLFLCAGLVLVLASPLPDKVKDGRKESVELGESSEEEKKAVFSVSQEVPAHQHKEFDSSEEPLKGKDMKCEHSHSHESVEISLIVPGNGNKAPVPAPAHEGNGDTDVIHDAVILTEEELMRVKRSPLPEPSKRKIKKFKKGGSRRDHSSEESRERQRHGGYYHRW